MIFIKKITLILIFGIIFAWIIFQIEPPQSLTTASTIQLVLFFLPLLLFLTFLINLFFQFWVRSLIIGLGITVMIALKGLDSLNLISLLLIFLAVFFLSRAFKKNNKKAYQAKILKISKLEKQR